MLAIDPVAEAEGATTIGAVAAGTAISTVGSAFSSTAAAGVPIETTNTTIQGTTDKLTTTATSTVTQTSSLAQFIKTQLNNIKMMMVNLANQARIEVQTAARNAKYAVKERALKAVDDAKNLVKQMKTFRFWVKVIRKLFRLLKYGYIVAIIFKNIGLWAVRVIEVLIYRIFHLKDCFIWYFLEMVGFILYIPVEFIVWLLCLKSVENSIWQIIDGLDCMFADLTGYHLIHYSDEILKRCYAIRFPPFPMKLLPVDAEGEFTEAALVKFMIQWFMPPTPAEIREVTHLILQAFRETGPIVADFAVAFMDEIGEMFKVHKSNEKEKVQQSSGEMVSV